MSDRVPAYNAAWRWAVEHGWPEPSDHMIDAALDALQLRTEYGWAPDGDASDVRVSKSTDREHAKRWVDQCVRDQGGSRFLREATEWRQEP